MKSRLVIFGVVIALLGAIAHAYQLAIEWQALQPDPQPVAAIYILTSPFFALLQMFLVFSFLGCGMGLLLHIVRKRTGLIVSIFGVIGVLLGHIEWYAFTRQSLPGLENELLQAHRPDMIPPHPFGLIGARWWDIAILLCSTILLIWEVKVLFAHWSNAKN
jgi:hypothetical protein